MARVIDSFFRAIPLVAALFLLPVNLLPAQGVANPGVAGIDIDADNVLRVRSTDPRLRQMQLQAAQRQRGGKIEVSPLRKVSLNRYEAAVAQAIKNGQDIDAMMSSVAGLTRLEYVMYLPGSSDIVIAGPAEEVVYDADGRSVGLKSGHPTLRLDDLIVALRASSPNERKPAYISCSIDPTQDGLARMQQYIVDLGSTISPGANVNAIAQGMKNSLGLQTVTIQGIPANTRFAQTLVEADYRMKLIGIGLERPPVRMRSWVDRVPPSGGGANSLQRWYFVADYEKVNVSPDGMVLQLTGQGVKLIGESERVDRNGNRSQTGGKGDPASNQFTHEFTEKFNLIADVTPVFFQMRNLFDLSVAATYIRNQDMYSSAAWDQGIFARESELPVEVVNPPEQVETAVNAIWRGGRLMTPIGGGVEISTQRVLKGDNVVESEELVKSQQNASAPSDLAAGQWWWD